MESIQRLAVADRELGMTSDPSIVGNSNTRTALLHLVQNGDGNGSVPTRSYNHGYVDNIRFLKAVYLPVQAFLPMKAMDMQRGNTRVSSFRQDSHGGLCTTYPLV